MTWAEFRIRSFAFRRMFETKEYLFREIAWAAYIAPNQDYKRMKKTKQAMWPIGNKKISGPTPGQIEAMKAAREQFNKDKKNG